MDQNLKPWDGIFSEYRYLHPDGLEVGEDGTIYYSSGDGVRCVWCAPCRIRHHLHRLYQISHRRPDDTPIVELIRQEVTA